MNHCSYEPTATRSGEKCINAKQKAWITVLQFTINNQLACSQQQNLAETVYGTNGFHQGEMMD